MKETPEKIARDVEVLAEFAAIYCQDHHGDAPRGPVAAKGAAGKYLEGTAVSLCGECAKLLLYAVSKRIVCPMDPKPACKKCPDHCYAPDRRELIRKVMRHSGMQMIRRGRLDLLKKYLF